MSEVLINQSTQPGDLVADPFMGSGSVGVAARKLGRRFIGTDVNPSAVRISSDRLKEFGAGHEPADPWIWEEVAQLEEIHAEVLHLRYRESLTYAEIAARLGLPHSTVRGRIHLARRALRARLGDSLDDTT